MKHNHTDSHKAKHFYNMIHTTDWMSLFILSAISNKELNIPFETLEHILCSTNSNIILIQFISSFKYLDSKLTPICQALLSDC